MTFLHFFVVCGVSAPPPGNKYKHTYIDALSHVHTDGMGVCKHGSCQITGWKWRLKLSLSLSEVCVGLKQHIARVQVKTSRTLEQIVVELEGTNCFFNPRFTITHLCLSVRYLPLSLSYPCFLIRPSFFGFLFSVV